MFNLLFPPLYVGLKIPLDVLVFFQLYQEILNNYLPPNYQDSISIYIHLLETLLKYNFYHYGE